MEQSEFRYYDYRDEIPPRELDEIIERQELRLPVLFVNGKPEFSGRLPDFEALMEVIRSQG